MCSGDGDWLQARHDSPSASTAQRREGTGAYPSMGFTGVICSKPGTDTCGVMPMSTDKQSYAMGGRSAKQICCADVSMCFAAACTSDTCAKVASLTRSMWHSWNV